MVFRGAFAVVGKFRLGSKCYPRHGLTQLHAPTEPQTGASTPSFDDSTGLPAGQPDFGPKTELAPLCDICCVVAATHLGRKHRSTCRSTGRAWTLTWTWTHCQGQG